MVTDGIMMNRYGAGAIALTASIVLMPVQLLVALGWPNGYSFQDNAISDLGVTSCGQFSEQGQQIRDVCSPWHTLFNAGMVLSGVLILIGAVLLYGWWDTLAGRAGTVLMALSGGLVAIAGLASWDVHPGLHDAAATGQAVTQWLAMVLLTVAATSAWFRTWTIIALVISIIGFIGFLTALEGVTIPLLGFGGIERLSFDTLTAWTVLVGIAILKKVVRP